MTADGILAHYADRFVVVVESACADSCVGRRETRSGLRRPCEAAQAMNGPRDPATATPPMSSGVYVVRVIQTTEPISEETHSSHGSAHAARWFIRLRRLSVARLIRSRRERIAAWRPQLSTGQRVWEIAARRNVRAIQGAAHRSPQQMLVELAERRQ